MGPVITSLPPHCPTNLFLISLTVFLLSSIQVLFFHNFSPERSPCLKPIIQTHHVVRPCTKHFFLYSELQHEENKEMPGENPFASQESLHYWERKGPSLPASGKSKQPDLWEPLVQPPYLLELPSTLPNLDSNSRACEGISFLCIIPTICHVSFVYGLF